MLLRRDCAFLDVVETSSLDEAVQVLGERPDITFASFDLTIPGLVNAIDLQSVREAFASLCMVVVTGSERRDDMLMALTAGAHGYVLKSWNTATIAAAIERVLSGEIFLPPSVADLPPHEVARSARALDGLNEGARVTQRQRDVLGLIRSGKSNKEIARALNLAESTVKVHTNALYRALGVHSRLSAAVAKPRDR